MNVLIACRALWLIFKSFEIEIYGHIIENMGVFLKLVEVINVFPGKINAPKIPTIKIKKINHDDCLPFFCLFGRLFVTLYISYKVVVKLLFRLNFTVIPTQRVSILFITFMYRT